MATTAAHAVGREPELAAIDEFLLALRSAGGVVVEGEPGIGKTTVWKATLEGAESRGVRVLRATPARSEAGLAFSSLADLLGTVLDEVAEDLPPPQRRALEAALLLESPAGGRTDRRAVGAGLLSTLRALARTQPVLVAVDDCQWLDRSSEPALRFAFHRLGDDPVALLLARRPGDAEDGLEQALPAERVLHVQIGPLDFLAMNRIVQDRLGTVLARPLLHRIHELSGGNPFFALELARSPEVLEAGTLPPTLEVAVRGRLEAMGEETRLGLLVAAAAAKPTAGLVEGILGAGALDEAEAAGFVALDHGSVRFLHPLLASGAYGSADPAQRRQVHERLAEAVPDPVERAYHLAAAATGPDERVAAGLDKGALRARARGAPAVAARLSQEAADLTPPELVESRIRRAAASGYYHFESGDSRRAVVLLEQAAAELEQGRARADVLTRLARVRSYSDDLAAATDLFLQAAEEAGGDNGLRARALEGASAQLFRRRRRLDEAIEYASEAAALARETGDDALLAQALSSQLLAEATLGRAEASTTMEAALELQPAVGAERIIAQPEWTAAVARMWWEDPSALRSGSESLIERAAAAGDEGSLAYVYVLLAQAECLVGDFDHGRRNAEAAREIADQAGQQALLGYGLAVRSWCDAHSGREDGAREAAGAALELGRSTQFMPVCQFAGAALGLLELSLGHADRAIEQLTPPVELARTEGIDEPGLTRYVPDQVEALIELDRLDEADELLRWYEGNAVRLGRRGAIAASYRCRGLLEAAAGQLDDALATFDRALAEHDGVTLPFDRARTLLVHGAALRRAKRKADARDRLEQAVAAFGSLSAAAYEERARAELARISGRRRSAGGLTPTERQIAELVAEGRSNKEVAAALFVSVKTVEANLSRVYAKLGLRGRGELARHVIDAEDAPKP
jgi:DNA-binding CsgD family transcriptional regulator